jgi:hypothetical protein
MELSGQLQAPSTFTPEERAPGTDWAGGRLCGSQSQSGRCGEEKHLAPDENQPVASRYTERAIEIPAANECYLYMLYSNDRKKKCSH